MKILRHMGTLLMLVVRTFTLNILIAVDWMLHSKSVCGRAFRMYVTTLLPIFLAIDLFKYSGLSEEHLFPVILGVIMLESVVEMAWREQCKEVEK